MSTAALVDTTCPYCGVGCGVKLGADLGGVSPMKAHPSNRGRVCVKGNALHETLGNQGRLLYPEVRGRRVNWETAINAVAGNFRAVIDEFGPDAVAIYGSGQLLTEDYYVANKFMKGFVGSANIDTNSRLCMASAVVAHKRAFGEDIVACDYEDVEHADLVVLVGSNAAWAHPVLYQRLAAAQSAHPGRRVVVVDPRETATCNIAQLHLAIAPGTDDWLFVGLLHWLDLHGHIDTAWCDAHCDNLGPALDAARAHGAIDRVAEKTQLPVSQLHEFYKLFAEHEKVVTLFSMGINQSTNGSDKGNAIINCHLATARIGRLGAGPFSITGQPNAMGGREVGGLANQLCAHRDFDDADAVERIANFWGSPGIARSPGLKAVDLFRAVYRGEIKAIWIMATNPAVSMPDSARVQDALSRCTFVAVSDCIRNTDTTACADVLLPALGWGEKDGTVTSAERTLSRQRAFLPQPGQARADWQIICDVATAMGFGEAFDFQRPAEIFREHARLSGLLNGDGSRAFDLGALGALSDAQYDALKPTQWPLKTAAQSSRPFADGRFYTPSQRAFCVAVVPVEPVARSRDVVLNTGRSRDQWHTMTRSARSARLMRHRDQAFVEIHPGDAGRLSVADGDLISLNRDSERYVGRAILTTAVRPGEVFAPIHWNGQFAKHGNVCKLIPSSADPLSGQPAFKHASVDIRAFHARWSACVVSTRPVDHLDADYWSYIPQASSHRLELAGDDDEPTLDSLKAASGHGADRPWLSYYNSYTDTLRAALVDREELLAVVALTRDGSLPDRAHTESLFARPVDHRARLTLLAGVPAADQPDPGRLVCACHAVGERSILHAIEHGGAADVDAIGDLVNAGTGCGSCRPELQALLASTTPSPEGTPP